MDQLVARMRDLDIVLTYDAKVIQKILDETYNPEYGARPVRRYIQDYIEDMMADSMLREKNKKTLHISVEQKELKFSWK